MNYVRLELASRGYLHFREMEVYGYAEAVQADEGGLPPPTNFSLGEWAAAIFTTSNVNRLVVMHSLLRISATSLAFSTL